MCDFGGMLVPIEEIISRNLQRCESSHYYRYAIVCLNLVYWDDQGILTMGIVVRTTSRSWDGSDYLSSRDYGYA